MNHKPRLAVVGLGAFGELHARTLAALADVELVAIGDRKIDRARALAAELNVPHIFSTIEDLVEATTADGLIIVTRTDSHVPIARGALDAGLHVLIEKPVGATAAEVESFSQDSRHSDRVVMAGHIGMFHSLTAPLVERVRREGFRAAHFVRHRPAATACVYAEEHPIRMTMVHDLYVLAQMVDNEEPIHLDAFDVIGATGRPDMSWATLRWSDGRVATLHSHWTLPEGAPADGWDRVDVFGGDYHASVTSNPQDYVWSEAKREWPLGLEISVINGRPTGMLAEELRAFAAACQGAPVPPGCRIEDALQVQQWIEQLMQSAKANRQA